ncbi:MAG: hypothetical protein AAGA48_11740 [Myxococcota bacterium]
MIAWLLACGPKVDIGPVPVETWASPAPVVHVNTTNDPDIHLLAMVRAGSGFDPIGEEGLAWLVAHALPAPLEVSVDTEWVTARLRCPRSEASRCIATFAEAVTTPRFEDWSTLQQAALTRIETPSSLADEVLHAVLFEGHRTGHPGAGRSGVVPSLTPEQGQSFFEQHYRRATFVAGTAGAEAEAWADALAEALLVIPSGPPADAAWIRPPTFASRGLVVLPPPVDEAPTDVRAGQVLRLAPDHADWVALHVGVAALDARLKTALGQQAFATLDAGPANPKDPTRVRRTVTLRVGASAIGNSLEMLDVLVSQVERWHEQGLGDAEFTRIRDNLPAAWTPQTTERALAEAVAEHAAGWPLWPVSPLSSLLRGQVDGAIKRWVSPNRFQHVMAGNPEVTDERFGDNVVELPMDPFR